MKTRILTFLTAYLFMLGVWAEVHEKPKACTGHKHEAKEQSEDDHTQKDKHNEDEKDHDDHDDEKDHDGHDHDKDEKNEKDHDGHDHGKDEKGEKDHDEDTHEDEKDKGIKLTSEQLKIIKLRISTAKAGDIKTKIFLPGEVKYNRDRMAQVMPRMPGFVSKIFKNEGDRVKAGMALATLQSHKLGELFAEYYSAIKLEIKTKAEFEIKSKLWSKKAVSEMEIIRARQEYAESQVARHRAEDKLASLGLTPKTGDHGDHSKDIICTRYDMISPITGTIISKNITIGKNYAEDNTEVPFIVADLSSLWLDLNARQSELPLLKKGMQVDVRFGKGFPDFHGKISYISPSFNIETRTVLVRVVLNNKDGILKPGLYANGIVSLGGNGHKVVVPRSAVTMIAGEKMVFVPEGKAFVAKPVTTGRSSGGFMEILSGLKAGQKYVSHGTFELKAVMLTSGMDPHAGHGH
jgi:membrane fusion protein, heavy metal efflux system